MMDDLTYEVEIAYNASSDYNPKFYFAFEDEMMNFVKLTLAHGYSVRIGRVIEDE